MNIYVTQLKRSIREKIEHVEDADYLATLDAILTYETISAGGNLPQHNTAKKIYWKKFWPFSR